MLNDIETVKRQHRRNLAKLPFEIKMLIASFITGHLPRPVGIRAGCLMQVPPKDSSAAIFLYRSKVKNFKLENMYIFSFLMHKSINVIDSEFARLNIMLALKLLVIRATNESENKELEYCNSNNSGNFLQKHIRST